MSNVGLLPTQAIADCPRTFLSVGTADTPARGTMLVESKVMLATAQATILVFYIRLVAVGRSRWLLTDWTWLKSTGHAVFVENTWLNRDPLPFEFAQGFLASQSASRNMG